MRITRDSLLQTARQFASQQVRKDRRLISIILTGSLLSSEPLLGGTTDIDLFFIHDSDPPVEREMVEISEGVHLDIAHLSQGVFRQPRTQRVDPWIAPFLCSNPIILHDTQHWLEFTQSTVCAQFSRPEYIIQRARVFADEARRFWLELKTNPPVQEEQKVLTYFKSLKRSGNAIATLSGNPLTERRFLLLLPERTQAIGRPGLAAGLTDLFMPQPVSGETWQSWLAAWSAALEAVGEHEACPAKIKPCRKAYYQKAAEALRSDFPAGALWPIMQTWTLAVSLLPANDMHHLAWSAACQDIGLAAEHFHETIKALDAYLDTIEETLDLWGRKMGL